MAPVITLATRDLNFCIFAFYPSTISHYCPKEESSNKKGRTKALYIIFSVLVGTKIQFILQNSPHQYFID